jgi:hypothetical protein
MTIALTSVAAVITFAMAVLYLLIHCVGYGAIDSHLPRFAGIEVEEVTNTKGANENVRNLHTSNT